MGLISWVKFKINEWHSWEDEHSKRAMRERYKIFHRISFLVLDLSPEYAGLSVSFGLLSAFALFSITLSLLTSAYLMSDDFADSSANANLGFLSTLALSFLINHNYHRKFILQLHSLMDRGLHDYHEPQYSPEEVTKWKKLLGKLNLVLVLLASYVVLIGFLVVVACPIIDEHLGFGWSEPYDENGINRQLPVQLWVPYPSHEGFGYWFSFLVLEGLGGAMITLTIGATALLFTELDAGLLMEQKLLYLSIKNLDKRARRRYKNLKRTENLPVVENGKWKPQMYEDPLYQDCVAHCLRENVKHHHQILKYTEMYLVVARFPLLFAFCVETMAIAMTMVKLNMNSPKIGANIAFCCIAVAEVANMIMLCVLGELVTSGSDEINQELYFTKWYRFNKQNRMTLLQFQLETRNPIVLQAMGLVICNMEQFSSVMNTAYSFFNLVKVSNLREEQQQGL